MFIILVSLYFVKGKSYEHSLIIYWTPLVMYYISCLLPFLKTDILNKYLYIVFLRQWPLIYSLPTPVTTDI